MAWVSVAEYCKKKGIESPQIIYNKIAMRKIPEGEWREIEVTVKRKQMKI